MLPVQKTIEDEQARPAQTTHTAILSPGAMVNAADELRQRLSDVDLDQITSATDRLSVLKAKFLRLQRALGIVNEMAACQSKVDQAADKTTAELNELRTKILEALAQLQRKQETHSVFVTETSSNDNDDQIPKQPLPPEDISLEFNLTAPLGLDDPVPPAPDGPREPDVSLSTSTDSPFSASTAPESTNINSEYNDSTAASRSERPDFAFLKGTSATSSFEFTDEASDNERSYTFEEASASLDPPIQSTGNSNPSVATDSVDFDKKLLDDLIKNYGEFVVSSELSSTERLSTSSEQAESFPAPKATSQPDSAINRSVPAYQTRGEFDQKLKKLIKDYGQVDLYSRRSSGKTRLRALAAFAVLGALLSGIYYFSAPKSAGAPRATPTETQGLDRSSDQTVTDNSSSVETKSASPVKDSIPLVGQVPPQTVEASESFGITDKQDIKKKIKRGGSKQ